MEGSFIGVERWWRLGHGLLATGCNDTVSVVVSGYLTAEVIRHQLITTIENFK